LQDKEAAAKSQKEAAKVLRQPCVYQTYTPDHCAVLVNFFWILFCHFLQDKEAAAKAKKEAAKALKETFKPLTSWWKEQLGSKVCYLVTSCSLHDIQATWAWFLLLVLSVVTSCCLVVCSGLRPIGSNRVITNVLKETFKPLTSWWKEQLGSKVCCTVI
jgi:hypothetical protein